MGCSQAWDGGDQETAECQILTEKQTASLRRQISNFRISDFERLQTSSVVPSANHAEVRLCMTAKAD
jgi:hypothetical protein